MKALSYDNAFQICQIYMTNINNNIKTKNYDKFKQTNNPIKD